LQLHRREKKFTIEIPGTPLHEQALATLRSDYTLYTATETVAAQSGRKYGKEHRGGLGSRPGQSSGICG
jgi:hypothetical protein